MENPTRVWGRGKFISHIFVFLALSVFSFSAANLLGRSAVEATASDILNEFRECERRYEFDPLRFESSERYRCFSLATIEATRKEDLRAVVAAVKEYFVPQTGELEGGSSCHGLAHEIGNVAVLSGKSGEEILTQCQDLCGFGCLNGAAHSYILIQQDMAKAESFCQSEEVSFDIRMGCYHGLGHGVSEAVGLDVAKGLERCRDIQDEEGRFQCGHAVLMAPEMNAMDLPLNAPENIRDFCGRLESEFQSSCFLFSGYIEYARTKDVGTALEACRGSVVERECSQRVGEAAYLRFSSNPEAVAQQCGLGEALGSSAVMSCIEGTHIASIHALNGLYGDFGLSVCAAVAPVHKYECYKNLFSLLDERYQGAVSESFCSKIPIDYRNVCAVEATPSQ